MQINGTTKIYGIMGNPVSHSLSPLMHNAAFDHLQLNNVYLPFPVEDVETAMVGFKALGVKGLSVTIPHKQAVIPFLDHVDPVAEKIGAINTLLIEEGKIAGHNTDWQGANAALQQFTTLAGAKVLLLGAGGSARAIGFGLLEEHADLTIASRTPAKGKALADTLGCPWQPLESVIDFKGDILINATSVGMRPNEASSPLKQSCLPAFKIVMDIVYSPLKTRLLQEAEEAGCQVIDGLAMLLFQGVAQFELWTGSKAPLDIMRHQLLKAMGSK